MIEDGRGLSDVSQGVTLEVFGEGWSMGPMNAAMKDEDRARQAGTSNTTSNGRHSVSTSDYLEQRGVSPNVASFVGATSVRIHELGEADRPPNARGNSSACRRWCATRCAKARWESARR